VEAAKRTDGGTLSIKTQYLVATVKGTKFHVMTTDSGAAVSVTEGVVSVRSIGSSDGVDVTRGRTAVVSSADGATPRVGLTPVGGALAAIEAVRSGSVSDSNHQAR
jgi:ferric-dicitrate binding protein FerR (iron transport regulator)